MKIIDRSRHILNAGQSLSFGDSFELLPELLETSLENQVEILSLLQQKGEARDEILGFEMALKNLFPQRVTLSRPYIDICGTGGDGKNTFNVSSTAAFIASGAGVCIAKSGNRAVSSNCGSSDVLAELGVPLARTVNEVHATVQRDSLVFVSTVDFFPGLAQLKEARQKVGGLTIFNLVGPLLNPCNIAMRVLGVPSLEKAHVMAKVLQSHRLYGSLVITGGNGEDEITIKGPSTILRVHADKIVKSSFTPPITMPIRLMSKVDGGTVAENAKIIENILLCVDEGPRAQMAILNAAAAIACFGRHPVEEFVWLAQESLTSGRAHNAYLRAKGC